MFILPQRLKLIIFIDQNTPKHLNLFPGSNPNYIIKNKNIKWKMHNEYDDTGIEFKKAKINQ